MKVQFVFLCVIHAAIGTYWGQFAIQTQLELSKAVSIDRISTIAIYNNAGLFEKNQALSVTEQLNLGIRWLDFDLHFIHELENSTAGPYRICSGSKEVYDYCSENAWKQCHSVGILNYKEDTGCAASSSTLRDVLVELKSWLASFDEDFLMVKLSDFTSRSDLLSSPNLHEDISWQLHDIFGSAIFTPLDRKTTRLWPTVGDAIAKNKRILFHTSSSTLSDSLHDLLHYNLEVPMKIDTFKGYPNCPSNALDCFQYSSTQMRERGFAYLVGSNSLSAEFAPEIIYEPNQCATTSQHGRWRSSSCNREFNFFACQSDKDSEVWTVSNSTRMNICPPGYSFSTPHSARENRILSDLLFKSGIESEVRLSLHSDFNGEWKVQDNAHAISRIRKGKGSHFDLAELSSFVHQTPSPQSNPTASPTNNPTSHYSSHTTRPTAHPTPSPSNPVYSLFHPTHQPSNVDNVTPAPHSPSPAPVPLSPTNVPHSPSDSAPTSYPSETTRPPLILTWRPTARPSTSPSSPHSTPSPIPDLQPDPTSPQVRPTNPAVDLTSSETPPTVPPSHASSQPDEQAATQSPIPLRIRPVTTAPPVPSSPSSPLRPQPSARPSRPSRPPSPSHSSSPTTEPQSPTFFNGDSDESRSSNEVEGSDESGSWSESTSSGESESNSDSLESESGNSEDSSFSGSQSDESESQDERPTNVTNSESSSESSESSSEFEETDRPINPHANVTGSESSSESSESSSESEDKNNTLPTTNGNNTSAYGSESNSFDSSEGSSDSASDSDSLLAVNRTTSPPPATPTYNPTAKPLGRPTYRPSPRPGLPTYRPNSKPTSTPTATPGPTFGPTSVPSPTGSPTPAPTTTPSPTSRPSPGLTVNSTANSTTQAPSAPPASDLGSSFEIEQGSNDDIIRMHIYSSPSRVLQVSKVLAILCSAVFIGVVL